MPDTVLISNGPFWEIYFAEDSTIREVQKLLQTKCAPSQGLPGVFDENILPRVCDKHPQLKKGE